MMANNHTGLDGIWKKGMTETLAVFHTAGLRNTAAILLCLLIICKAKAQNIQPNIFTVDAFIQQVKMYHPVAKQADILVDKAASDLLSARGAFDPSLNFAASRKTFDGKNYYYYSNPELTLPLPVGNIRSGIENNGGNFITSEVTTGKTSYLGIEVPLARGLLLDKRRAVLQQAKIFRSQSEQERMVQINNLLFDAYNTYWYWAGSYQLYNIYSNFTSIAGNRLRLVRISYENGDRAAMDTMEAFVQMQNYLLLQNEALLKWKNASLELSTYLWEANDTNYDLPDNTFPDSTSFDPRPTYLSSDELITQSNARNPALKIYDYKLNALTVEQKLKRQDLLPYLSLKANLLNRDYFAVKGISRGFLENNYQWGIDFRFPLFLRQARGGYRNVQLKIKETQLELAYKRQQTENKIRTYHNEISALSEQLKTVETMLTNYKSLLRNEELKFTQGESSLFLVNSRETKVIEILQKQIELTVKYYKARYAVLWAAGVIQ
jgi:outer membrane protein TolC